jgi:hypothetical protein
MRTGREWEYEFKWTEGFHNIVNQSINWIMTGIIMVS